MSTMLASTFSSMTATGRPITGSWGTFNSDHNYYTHPIRNTQLSKSPHFKDIFTKGQDDIGVNLSQNNLNNVAQDFNPLFYNTPNSRLAHKQGIFPYQNVSGTDSGYNSPDIPPIGHNPYTNKWNTIPEEDDFHDCSDSDDDIIPFPNTLGTQHPNKYPVQIEYHDSKFCNYKRQGTRSGEKLQMKPVKAFNPASGIIEVDVQKMKTYQKHLVRICRCGRYQVMDGALQQGRPNDCNGYEIHYNQKCRWKAYDDMVTGKRVLIRLCKCYKPIKN